MTDRTTLIFVLGMHRSGTSAFTRCLHELGVALPTDLMPPSSTDNARGYWESQAVVEINNRILECFNLTWNSPGPLPENWVTSNQLKEPLLDAVQIIESLKKHAVVALKDPRLSRVLPLWLTGAKKAQVGSTAVVCVRHPLTVADSLARRDSMEKDKALILWLRHTVEALTADSGAPQCVVTFERLVEDPVAEMQRVASSLLDDEHIDWSGFEKFAKGFVSSDQIHASKASVDGLQPELLELALELQRDIADNSSSLPDRIYEVQGRLAAMDQISGAFINRADAETMAQKRQAVRLYNQVTDLKKENAGLKNTEKNLVDSVDKVVAPLRDELIATTSDKLTAFQQHADNQFATHEEKTRNLLVDQLSKQTDTWNALQRELKRAVQDIGGQLWSEKLLIKKLEAESAARNRAESEAARLQREVLILQTRFLEADSAAKRNAQRLRQIQRSLVWKLLSPVRNVHKVTRLLSPAYRRQKTEWRLVASDPHFDSEWYVANYPDVSETEMTPAEHYCRHGWREGRDPGPDFSTLQYLALNPDVKSTGTNPLVHFIKHGRNEGRPVLEESGV